jgi:hypothetical protein
MRGENLARAAIGWYGIEGDRRYAFVKEGNLTGFPWLTGREIAEMVLYTPRFTDPDNLLNSAVMVKTPGGAERLLTGDELLQELASRWRYPITLTKLKKGCHDAMPLSLIGTGTIRAMGEKLGMELDFRRFRPNILMELDEPFIEENWLGDLLTFGEREDSAKVRLNRQNARCAFTTVDPDSAARTPEVLKAIVKQRSEYLGLYGSAEKVGSIQVGDVIYRG